MVNHLNAHLTSGARNTLGQTRPRMETAIIFFAYIYIYICVNVIIFDIILLYYVSLYILEFLVHYFSSLYK
jgi:hypothetical protein